jgi:succinate dehydrogenase flavin-adding protein (antitoxin of CptAB toxin-antitoxin module)
MAEHDRIRWRCRRGLLELDLILARFLDSRLAGLDAGQLEQFKDLLEETDNDLLDMAMGRQEPAPRHRAMVEMLRGIQSI